MLKHQDKLRAVELKKVLIMFDLSPTLSTAYFLIELYYSIFEKTDSYKQKN